MRMEVEQRFPRMQLVRKAAEQYHRLRDRSRPTLNNVGRQQPQQHHQANRETTGSVTSGGAANVQKRNGDHAVNKNGPILRKWRPSKNGLKSSEDSNDKRNDCQQTNNRSNDMTMLQLLAFNALDLTAPASDILLRNRRSSWVQLSGHPGSFAPAGPGTLWKKQGSDNNERVVYEALMKDSARDIVPRFDREVCYKGESFIEMQDLLYGFTDPNVMDIKLGTRTFLESEVTNTTARADLYQKMVKVDPSAPTKEENETEAVTKLRYMMFREQQSSTCSLGFRIEAIKFQGKPPVTDLKTVRTREAVCSTLELFLNSCSNVRTDLLTRLKYIRDKFQQSPYFQTHEVVGSSILIIYDNKHVGAWMIDFAKTLPLPEGVTVTHRRSWQQGNHEEGYLTGIDNLIEVIEESGVESSIESENPVPSDR